jgi:hypothetical protein
MRLHALKPHRRIQPIRLWHHRSDRLQMHPHHPFPPRPRDGLFHQSPSKPHPAKLRLHPKPLHLASPFTLPNSAQSNAARRNPIHRRQQQSRIPSPQPIHLLSKPRKTDIRRTIGRPRQKRSIRLHQTPHQSQILIPTHLAHNHLRHNLSRLPDHVQTQDDTLNPEWPYAAPSQSGAPSSRQSYRR